jgi:N-acetylglucosamine-6-phosphate deacetylase
MISVLTADHVFDGESFRDHCAVVVEGNHIARLMPRGDVPASVMLVDLGSGILAPGFIDVQVNGGGGALMNDSPTIETVRTIAKAHRGHGTTSFLPTVITDTPAVISAAVAAVQLAISDKVPGVLGIHIEGPYLDPRRKGAHAENLIRTPTAEDVDYCQQLRCGQVMMTVAPNVVSASEISALARAGIKVSLGHSEANFAETSTALKAGASAFTHLFNAMSQMTAREPGMVGAALADKDSFIGIIADGFHIHDATLKIALSATATDRFMLTSDAMPPAAGGPDSFLLQGRRVTRHEGRLLLEDGTLAGSNLTMDEALRHCVHVLGLPLAKVLQMASRNPAHFLGRGDLGHLAPGCRANLVFLDDNLQVKRTWIDGQ